MIKFFNMSIGSKNIGSRRCHSLLYDHAAFNMIGVFIMVVSERGGDGKER
jgi:hypothetical protein